MNLDGADFSRVAVVGISGAGKSTLSRALAKRLGAKRIELDELYWDADWEPKPPQVFRSLVADAVSEARWVSDGNYSAVRPIVWPRATLLVWLDLPFATVLWQTFVRSIGRVVRGERLWHGNRESLARMFLSRESILLWVIRNHGRRRREYDRMIRAGEWPHLRWIRLRSRREAHAFLAALEAREGLIETKEPIPS